MKVKDLIIEIRKLNPDLDVRCVEDGPTPLRSDYPGPFEITNVGSHHVLIARDSAGLVSITFDPRSQRDCSHRHNFRYINSLALSCLGQ